MAHDIQAKPAPPINLPKSNETCDISILNTTCDLAIPPHMLVEPDVPGFEWLNLPTYSFYITHKKTGAQVLFDLGMRKDWQNCVPHIAELVGNHLPGVRIQKDVTEVLEEGNVKLKDVKSLILSHWHFDHSGNIANLPQSVDLVVGPGFKDEFLPGYPAKEGSPFWEADFKGRNVIEAPFDTKIGKFNAWDYFGDGSLYVLDTPGHAVGHVSALVRTTPDTAIFLGGDLCHFTGDIRPTEYVPMPDPIPAEAILDARIKRPAPCTLFTACHPNQAESRTTPYFQCSSGPGSFYADPPTAMNSIRTLMEFDADPNILTIIAHDSAPNDIVNFFPDGTINDWQQKGWKASMHWHFLNELPINGKQERNTLCDGLYQEGKKLKNLDGKAV